MLLYISQRFDKSIAAKTHLKAITEIVGADQVFIVDLRLGMGYQEKRNYIAYGQYKNKLELLIQMLQGNTEFISNRTIRAICKLVGEKGIDTVFVEDSMFGSLVKQIKKEYPHVRIITFFHDICADLMTQWKKKKNFFGRLACDVAIHQEKIQCKYSDINVVFNERDAKLCEKYHKIKIDYIVPLSWDAPIHNDAYMSASSIKKNPLKLLFVGANYWPNIIGIKWFFRNVFPQIESFSELMVVGRGTEILKKDLNHPRVCVVGSVDDLSQVYRETDVVIIPLFDGGGMKMKTVEALAFGKIVISTQEGLEGYWDRLTENVKGKRVFRSNEPEEWSKIINALFEQEIRPFYNEVYQDYRESFSYPALKQSFELILKTSN